MTTPAKKWWYLLRDSYYPGVVASMGYDVWDWSTLNAGTLFQDSAKTTPASANGDVVGCWTDGVGGVDATQVTTANKPGLALNSLNGLPMLSFDGSDLLTTANIAISTFAVWAVFTYTSKGMTYEHSVNSSLNDGMSYYLTSFRARRSATASDSSKTTVTPELFRGEFNGAATGYVNNVAGPTGATIATTTATAPLFIGARSGVNLGTIGNMAHLCIVSPYPTPAIIAQMESYINGLWGVY